MKQVGLSWYTLVTLVCTTPDLGITYSYVCRVQTIRGESPLHLALRLNCIDIARFILEASSFDILLSDSRQPSRVKQRDMSTSLLASFIDVGTVVTLTLV